MKYMDPIIIALQFNEHINYHDLWSLSNLICEGHQFIDRKENIVDGKINMAKIWEEFFILFPEYRNTFTRIVLQGNLIIMYGYAKWKRGDDPDYDIWTATIENDHVSEWRIYENSETNKKLFNLG
jgi:predicted SnoaL-like aldol condensation-catalyzing enzyme